MRLDPGPRADGGAVRGLFVALLGLVAAGCSGTSDSGPGRVTGGTATPPATGGFRFVEVGADAGLTRVVWAGRPGKDHLLDSAGTGAGWLDYDGDGSLDLYVVNGWRLADDRVVERGRNALYRNRGDGTFDDVTDVAGVDGGGQWGSGVAVADYDDDDRPDLFVTNFGPNVLYRNRGDGTFENVAARAGVEAPGWNTGAAFFDADGDGNLDLYVAAYIDATIEDVLRASRSLDWKGAARVAVGPFGLEGARDHFFVNDGRGRFDDATERAGLTDLARGYGFAVRAADFDADGDNDLYVANDSDANYYYRNEGDGTFRETGLWNGSALDVNGAAQAGMGVAVGDADGDGALDLFVTNFSEDFSTLYNGDGQGFFDDVSATSGAGPATYASLSWGTAFADLDNDGDQDLVVANGHIYPQVDAHPEFGMTYAQRNLLLGNDGTGHFTDVTENAGPGFALVESSRGLAVCDYDNDGDLDLLFTQLDGPPTLLRNESSVGAWLTVDLDVPAGAGPRIGASVTVEAGGHRWRRDLASGESFLSAHDPRLHFGLGDIDRVDRVVVRWSDGTETVLSGVSPGRILRVRKNTGRPASAAVGVS